MVILKKKIPVKFCLARLVIRWSDHLLVKEKGKIIGEAVVYGGDWEKAERLARQIAERKFRAARSWLPVCEQLFIEPAPAVRSPLPWSPPASRAVRQSRSGDVRPELQRGESTRRGGATAGFGCDYDFFLKEKIGPIRKRRSNLKVKVGRDVHDDIQRLTYIRRELKFRNAIRIDANQGYSLKQLTYLLPTLLQRGIHYVEEPVRRRDLPAAVRLLHENGLEVILDEIIQKRDDWEWVVKNKLIDVLNLKLARVGDLDEALWYIKQAKKHHIKIIIGCSEELERGMKAIYALGHIAKKEGVLLEVEGFGPLRLKEKAFPVPRVVNRIENAWLMFSHRVRQEAFDLWWSGMRLGIQFVKETKKLSALSLRLVQWTGKHKEKIHPKHLVAAHLTPWHMSYFKQSDVVLDIGCGNGQHAVRVARSTKRVAGFDIDQNQLTIAKRTALNQGITNVAFELRSAEEPFPYQSKSFNNVMFFAVLEHLEHRDQILDGIHRVLKPGGLLLLGVPNEWTLWKVMQRRFGILHYTDPDHKVEYSKKSITEELTRHHFRVKLINPTAFDTPWAGFIDLVGGLSLSFYERLLKWKWAMAKKYPQDSISWNIVAEKLK